MLPLVQGVSFHSRVDWLDVLLLHAEGFDLVAGFNISTSLPLLLSSISAAASRLQLLLVLTLLVLLLLTMQHILLLFLDDLTLSRDGFAPSVSIPVLLPIDLHMAAVPFRLFGGLRPAIAVCVFIRLTTLFHGGWPSPAGIVSLVLLVVLLLIFLNRWLTTPFHGGRPSAATVTVIELLL